MALDRILCCVKSIVWLPDEFLTTITGNCDKGEFVITQPFTFPCMLLANGNLYIEEQEGMELPRDKIDLSHIQCGGCGGEVEIREIDLRGILDKLRQREITMKQRRRERESGKIDKADKQEPRK